MTQFNNYVARLEEIRRLSTPSMQGIPDADSYSDRLRDNFREIGRLAAENRAFLSTVFFPTIAADHNLSPEEAENLIDLGNALLSSTDVENLDLPIMSLISERLLEDAEEKGDLSETIHRLDTRMDTCYALMTMMGRASANMRIADRFRREGLSIGRRLFELLDHETFARLDAECRNIVLTDVRYMAVFFEGLPADDPEQLEQPVLLDRVLQLADDPFYADLAGDFNWRYFRYRALNYYAKTTDMCNHRHFDADMLQRIWQRTEQFAALWQSDPEYFSGFDNEKHVNMLLTRNRYLAGRIGFDEYHDALLELYRYRNPDQYDLNGIYDNLQLPAEALCLLDPDHLPAEVAARLPALYRNVILYAFRMPNSGSLSSLLEYYVNIIDRFIEVPGGPTFEEMALQCLAALHPPTYIHSVMVGKLARCLCGHIVERRPELLAGVPGFPTAAEVRARRDAIADFVFHAALCHDFGKLTIIDTIFVYGRNLFDMEYGLIRSHPRSGWELLMRHASTRPYADVALGHHRFYDNKGGYPEDFDTSESPLKPVIDLIQCADCLDAATDSVGRSYRAAKTFEEFVAEITPDLGTHYPPWLRGMLDDPDIQRDLRALLRDGRRETYRKTYYLLKAMCDGD